MKKSIEEARHSEPDPEYVQIGRYVNHGHTIVVNHDNEIIESNFILSVLLDDGTHIRAIAKEFPSENFQVSSDDS